MPPCRAIRGQSYITVQKHSRREAWLQSRSCLGVTPGMEHLTTSDSNIFLEQTSDMHSDNRPYARQANMNTDLSLIIWSTMW
eukprot:6237031-Amphidinium_carterae.1